MDFRAVLVAALAAGLALPCAAEQAKPAQQPQVIELDAATLAAHTEAARDLIPLLEPVKEKASSRYEIEKGSVPDSPFTGTQTTLFAVTIGKKNQPVDPQVLNAMEKLLKWEPGIAEAGDPPTDFERYGFRQSSMTIQPPRTILIDIGGDDEAILSRMNQGTRRKIRQSQKHAIRYYEASRSEVSKFTRMMETTGSRNEFGVHEPGYYTLAYDLFVPQHAALILAEHTDPATDETPERTDQLAGVFVFAIGKTAWYFYGASGERRRRDMPNHLLQWEALRWARAQGCTVYDWWGAPTDPGDPEDAMQGVWQFKQGFGAELRVHVGAWDYAPWPRLYAAYARLLPQVIGLLRRRAGEP